jgi:hypothetical protein
MKKLLFLFFLVLGFSALNIAHALAACTIVWWGDLNGSVLTEETSRTQQASLEAFQAIFGYSGDWDGSCYHYSYDYSIPPPFNMPNKESFSVCNTGTWGHYLEQYRHPICYAGCYWYGEWDVVCESTLIKLSSFIATPKSGKIILSWNTASETDNVGFNLYRAESENGEYIQINDSLIPSKGSSTQGASYEFADNDVKNRKTYYYKLEDIDLNGISTLHGPITATPRLIFGMGK